MLLDSGFPMEVLFEAILYGAQLDLYSTIPKNAHL